MIELPRKSVTRFFIPLIDVFTLLFCIFLLMPLIKAGGEPNAEGDADPLDTPAHHAAEPHVSPLIDFMRSERMRLRKDREELDQLKSEKREVLQQKLLLRVLEIDADTGKLYYQEGEKREEIGSQADALRLIRSHREAAEERELYYLFLYPRRLTGFPLQSQARQYESWFKGVAHGMDNPHQSRQ